MTAGQGRLAGRIALVTGASRGIGAAIAERYAAEGAHVYLVARTQGGLEEVYDRIAATGGAATGVPLDLRQPEGIERLSAAVHARFGRLDILVGNAGALGMLTPVPHLEPGTWEEVMSVNATANYRLIRSFDPLLRAADAGRAIFVSSGAARGGFAYWGAYAASKAALEALVSCWAAECAKTPLRINTVDPGAVRTRMRAEAFPGEDPLSLRPPEALADAMVELAEASCTRHGEVVRVR
ncbi:MAG: SDR family NAD(P)-dependent oxidoreductase [Alphaproteobacteria bacterium]